MSSSAEDPARQPSPLHHLIRAAEAGDLDGVRAALSAGADVDGQALGTRPLHCAAFQGHLAVAELLLAEGAKVDATDEAGVTPLLAALARLGSSRTHADYLAAVALVLLLLDKRADPSASVRGNTALHMAAKTGEPLVLEALLAKGADTLARNDEGALALHVVAGSKRPDGLAALLRACPDQINATDDYGWAPLHYLADVGGPEAMFSALLEAGADPSLRSTKLRGGKLPAGMAPIDVARHWSDAAAVELLQG